MLTYCMHIIDITMTDRKWARDHKTSTLWLEMETEIVGCDISELTRSGTLRGKRGARPCGLSSNSPVPCTVRVGKWVRYTHAHTHTHKARCIGSWHTRPKRPGSLVLSQGGTTVFCMACMALHGREVEPAAEIPCARVASGWVWMRKWVWACLLLGFVSCVCREYSVCVV